MCELTIEQSSIKRLVYAVAVPPPWQIVQTIKPSSTFRLSLKMFYLFTTYDSFSGISK